MVIEDAGLEQLILGPGAAAPAVLLDQLMIRKLLLRVLVQHLHVAVCGSVIEVEVVLLYILTMIAFARRQAEHPLFQNGVSAIPE